MAVVFQNARQKIILNKSLLVLASIYFIYCLSLTYSREFQWGVIEKKASLLVFPIIFTLGSRMAQEYGKEVFKYFTIGCIMALLISETNAFLSSLSLTDFSFNTKIDSGLTLYRSIIEEKNRFFSFNFSTIHQTVYFSMYLCLSVAILLYKKIFTKKTQVFFICFLVIGVVQLLNKAGLIVLFILFAIKAFKSIRNLKWAFLLSFLILMLGSIAFILNPRFEKSNLNFKISESTYDDITQIPNTRASKTNTRMMLWASSLELIKEHPFFGIGAGASHQVLYERFAIKRQWYDKSERHHAHNQYLQILLDIGLLGFIPFMAVLFFLIGQGLKRTNGNVNGDIILAFALIIGINFLFESLFERYSGISFFSFFYCLFMACDTDNFKKLNLN